MSRTLFILLILAIIFFIFAATAGPRPEKLNEQRRADSINPERMEAVR